MEKNLERFVKAQEHSYENALREIRAGRKTGHWMWYIFPQAKGLGFSDMAAYYGIDSLEEAVSDMKSDMERKVSDMKGDMEKEVHGLKDEMEKEVTEIKGEMSKQAAAHNAELSSLYKLINTVANDVSFIRGRMSQDGEK